MYSRRKNRHAMKITIRKASAADLERLMEIFRAARKFMVSAGNPDQWIDGYPQRKLIAEEIAQGHCYVCATSDRTIVGTFCFSPGPDPTYDKIYNGNWLNDEPYRVIHRLASDGSAKGIGKLCIDWCIGRCKDLRTDTHANNRIMQSLVERCGFVRCGTIRVANGTSRIAYHRTAR